MEKPPSQRQLKVGESIRRSLSEFFMRGEIPYLDGVPITVSEVRISPDLHNATAYIMPLGGKESDKVLEILAKFGGFIRTYVSKDVKLRTAPRINFRIDNSYDEGARISALLSKIEK